MNVKLTIQEKLKDLRIERHLTLEQLAAETGISKSALGKYESDDFKDISPFSITTLAKYYGVSTDYLLGLTETKNHPNADLQDLHLSDEMIALLKSGSINNRQQIMEKYNPDENDLYLRTLELAQVKEEDYFAHVVHRDLDGILHDIREVHRADTTTADTASPAMDIHQQLETAMHYEGTEEERKARIFLASLGIDYDKLTQEEFVTQINILKKSAHLKSANNLRGKSVPYMVHGKGNRKKRK